VILPSNTSLEELTRVFRLIQSGLGLGSSGNGVVGKDGKPGKDGRNGRDGQDGSPGGVTSWNGRTGIVVPATGDYGVADVTGAAPIASPTFTGDPKAPTPTLTDNDTSIATTAFVKGQGYQPQPPNNRTLDFTGFYDPANVIVSYDSATRKVTLTGTVEAYYQGQLVTALTSGWVSDAHPNTNGAWFLLYNGSAFIWQMSTPWLFSDLMICYVNFGASNKWGIRECHSFMQWLSHKELHETLGTYLNSGGDLTGYTIGSTTAAERRPAVAITNVSDEDLPSAISSLADNGPYTILNLASTGTSTFTLSSSEIVPVSGNQPYWNQFSSPNWVQTLMSNNSYMTVFLVAVPTTADAGSLPYRYLWMQGQSNGSLASQQSVNFGSLNTGQLSSAFTEFVPIGKIIIRYQGGNWSIYSVEKLTGTRVSSQSSLSGGFLSTVTTDASMTGTGTGASPLVVARTATVPLVNGTAAVGTADTSSRSDHVHPTDTSRAADSAVVHNTGNETGLAGNKTWTGIATFSNSTASTTTTSGALVVTGGVGIGGGLNVGGTTGIDVTNAGGLAAFIRNNSATGYGAWVRAGNGTNSTYILSLEDKDGNPKVRVLGDGAVSMGVLTATSGSFSGAFGCNGNTAQGKYTVNAASTDLATVVALCNQLRAALIANGICV